MNLDEFILVYKPVLKNPNGGTFFEKYVYEDKKDIQEVYRQHLNEIWILCDQGDFEDHSYIIKPGFSDHFNKYSTMGWILTLHPWSDTNLVIEI